jgi:hypothetical protein
VIKNERGMKMAEITRGRHTYIGFKEVDGKIVCGCCGGTRAKIIAHVDAIKYSSTILECKCGNTMSVVSEHSKLERSYWM